ncbi:sulfate reduction electron transfer complex DsrMKJOP subunit DsrJ [bacterium]|nr:sulfate reduction electron transfer complex DsrMKJOP subunit DsrJ [bacterium]
MYDGGKIILGLIIFLGLILFPVWYNIANGKAGYTPDLEIITADDPGRDACVMSSEYMRPYHMDLLNEWRDEVVRERDRIHVAPNGKEYNRSLTGTCMDCHSNKENFCDRCHTYMDVNPYCWECHNIPEGGQR